MTLAKIQIYLQIYPATVQAWLSHFTARKDVVYVECSAKCNENLEQVFHSLLQQSGFPDKQQVLAAQAIAVSPMPHRRFGSQRTTSARQIIGGHGGGASGEPSASGLFHQKSFVEYLDVDFFARIVMLIK